MNALPNAQLTTTAAAPPVVTPPPGNPRFVLLDGLRAIAALSVVALHVCAYTNYFPGWQGAYVRQLAAGVTVFFLLSGFLLYRPFVAARLSGRNRLRTRDYARRRLLRILPAYWIALTFLGLWSGLPGHPLGSDWWRYYLFLQDFRERTLFDGLGTAWSLGTEVSFYLLLPLYALALDRPAFRRTTRSVVTSEFIVLAGASALSLAFRSFAYGSHPNLDYTLFGTFDWFALGMALAVVSAAVVHTGETPRVLRIVERRPSICWAAALGALTCGAAYWERTFRYDPYSGGLLHLIWGAFALLLLLPAAFPGNRRGVPRRVLSIRFLAWLGIVSYGIYLWHLPLIPELGDAMSDLSGAQVTGLLLTFVLFVIVAAVTIMTASASYYIVERPILRFKNGLRVRRSRPGMEALADAGSVSAS